MKKLIIFDLDGTLLNTIADLANSTNYALRKLGYPSHPKEAYNFMVGNGINKLLERALPENKRTENNILHIRELFLELYDQHNTDESTPYEGISELLNNLQEKGVMLAVASNKYQTATRKLVKHYFNNIKFIAVFGQRDGIKTKPDPTIVYNILEIAKVTHEDILYVGDSGVDMETALNSNICSCGVTWGFRPRAELEQFKPNYIVDKASDILSLI